MKRILLTSIIFLSFNAFGQITPEIRALNQKPQSILFIGNSYLYYNDSLHNHFKSMADERYPQFNGSSNVKSATIGGSRLKHHNVDRLTQPFAISSVKKFDLVILQGGSGEGLSDKMSAEIIAYSKDDQIAKAISKIILKELGDDFLQSLENSSI